MSNDSIQTWFNVYAQCQDALRGGDSLEIESAKSAYHQTQEEHGDPPVDRDSFGVFHNSQPTIPGSPGDPLPEAKAVGLQSVRDILGASGGIFALMYRVQMQDRAQGTSQHPPPWG